MQRPPDKRTPQVLFTRPANEWINRVNQKHKEFVSLSPSAEQKEKLQRLAEAEFIYSTLELEGVKVSRESIARIIHSLLSGASETDESSLAIAEMLKAIRAVESLVRANGRAAALTPDLLIQLQDASGRAKGFRKSAGDTGRLLKPVPAAHLAAALESACRWFSAESFAELNPIEQASIAFLRLIEIEPFEQANERAALVAASLFTLRSELPLITIRPELDRAYRAALDEAARLNTAPMVELIADAVEHSLAQMIERIKDKGLKGEG